MSEAQQRLVEIEEQEKQLAEEKAKLLAASKNSDLALVRKLCRQHGFTATQLRGYLRGKGRGKKAAADDEKKPVAKRPAAKKAPGKAGKKINGAHTAAQGCKAAAATQRQRKH